MDLNEYNKKLAAHDWYSHMSDDHRVWAAGERAWDALLRWRDESDAHDALFHLWHRFMSNEITKEFFDSSRQKLGVL